MATSSLYGNSSESIGLYGIGSASGGTYFEWFIFYDSATAPATPTGGSWSFTTNTGTAPTGWLNAPPASPSNLIWVSIAIVDSRSTAALTWSVPGLMAASGLPVLTGSGVPSAGTGVNGQLYINTATTPQSMYNKQSGSWVQITGSNLVDLVNNQTIGGIKTFSSPIVGSVTGTAGNVSGVVAIANGGTNASTASAARTNLGLGTISTQDASNVAITGGSITGITDLAVADGGTGASTAANARTNLGAVGLTDTQTLTNKTIDGASNTLTNIGNGSLTNSSVTINGSGISLGGSVTITAATPNNLVFGAGLSATGNFNGSVATNVTLANVGTAATYGDSGTIPVFTTNAFGQIASVSLQSVVVDSADISGTIAIAQGGTGASSAANARINLLPSYAGNGGKVFALNAGATDVEWRAVAGTGTVSSVAVSGGSTGLTTSGGPITAAGTITIGGTLAVGSGGTGVTTSTGSGSVVLSTGASLTNPIINQINDSNNNEILGFSATASATDFLTVKNGIGTGVPLHVYADGSSANIGLHIQPKGTGLVTISDGTDFNKGIRFRSSSSAASAITLLDAVSTAGRVVTLPDATTTLVGRDTTDTLTNKTIAFSSNTFSGTLAIANGGTNASTAASAIENLLPSYTGNGGKGLRLNSGATAVEWVADGGGDVVGPASAVANSIALFNSTTGKLIKDSSASDGLIYGITVGRGLGAIDTNTALGNVALATNTTGVQNTAVGRAALNANTTGSNNTAVGRSALQVSTASDNTAVGHASLQQTTTGASNTAFGAQALLNNTTASNNTAVGYQAAYANTTGQNNVAVGYQALDSNTTGGTNTAIGSSALQANTTAANNTAIGYQAGNANTTGFNVVAVGFQSLLAHTTGNGNTAVGISSGAAITTNFQLTAVGANAAEKSTTSWITAIGGQALRENTSGAENAAVGGEALRDNTTGSNNTAVGRAALQANTTASNNTAVGYQAGYTNTTGASCVFVGYRAGYVANAEGNTIVGYHAGLSVTAGYNTFVGFGAGSAATTGTGNTFIGYSPTVGGAGNAITTGAKNTILGGYTGNNDSLDIRTASNYVVIADGDGTRQITMKEGQTLALDSAVPNAGTGITFPATQSASTNANTLDDYEEGTWTAGFSFGNGTTGITYANQAGFYTRIGNMVNVTCQAELSNKGSSTGAAKITGLPFTIANNIGNDAAGAIRFGNITYLGMMEVMGARNTTTVVLEQVDATGNRSNLADTNFSNSSFVVLNLTYRV